MRRFPILVAAAVVALVGASCSPDQGGGATDTTTTVTVAGQPVTVSSPPGSTLAVAPAAPGSVPLIAESFPLGPVDIDVSGIAHGAVVRVKIVLQTPVNTIRKLIAGNWDPFTHNGTTGGTVSADGRTVTLDLQDGGRGDADGTANGTVVDPVLLGQDAGVVPTMTIGQPFSHQLQATGATGPVTWTVLSGTLLPGITLDPSGLLSGTPSAGGPSLVRVRADDGSGTATKLLTLLALTDSGPTSNGTPLPEGTSLSVGQSPFGPAVPGVWLGNYQAAGTLARLSTYSVSEAGNNPFGLPVNRAGTRVVVPTPPVTTGPSTGPVVVVDGDTGNPIVTVEPSPAFQYAGASFSPDDAHLALSDSNSATTRIIDTTTWATVRIVSGTNLRWSPDSTELAARQLTAPTTISIYSATDPLADRTVAIPGQSCSQVSDWSSTGRVALTCGFGGVITASVSGPLDVRVLVAAPTIPTPGVLRGVVPPKFSPSGALLAFGEVNVTSFSPFAFDSSRIVIAPDAEGATFTPMTDPAPAGLAVGALGWTGTAAPPPPPPTTTTTTTLPTTTTTPTTPHPASALDAGTYHACAVVTGGAVKCWGSNESGELGNGASGPSAGSTTPVTVTGLTGATSVALGMYHSCALIDDGTVTCWGENGAGQLGNGTTNDSSVPVTVPGITGATAITSASGATCVIVAGGAVKCWGISYYGELGTTNSSAVPVDVAGVTGATAIAGGAFHMCALVANGAVSCWGRNYQGQLGNGHSGGGVDSTAPVSVVGITGATAISAHANEHTCAVLADTTVECWGNNSVGQLGNGTSTDSPVPVPVTGVTGVTAINSGSNHTCAVVAGGAVKCWGVNGSGQLGNGGSGSNSNLAVNVVGLTGAVAMAGGNMFTCAVTVDGHVKCWGTNSDYGSGPSAFSSLTPFNVPGIP